MENCLFCKITAKEIPSEILYEDEHIVAFPDIRPKADIHVLVVPKMHIINLMDINDDNQNILMHLMRQLPSIAKQLGLTGFRTVFNSGKESGQEVFHIHAHLLGGNMKFGG